MTRHAMQSVKARQCSALNGERSMISVTLMTFAAGAASVAMTGGVYCRLMRLCRFDENRVGIIDGDVVRDVTAALDVLPQVRYPLPAYDPLIANLSQVLTRARAL